MQCGDEGGADPGDSLSRENEKVQTRGDLFKTFQLITLSPRWGPMNMRLRRRVRKTRCFCWWKRVSGKLIASWQRTNSDDYCTKNDYKVARNYVLLPTVKLDCKDNCHYSIIMMMLITIIDHCNYHYHHHRHYSRGERPDAVVERAQKGEKPQSSQVAHLIFVTFFYTTATAYVTNISPVRGKKHQVVSSEQGFWIISNRLKSYWEQMLTAVQEVS